jgi:hypothetical protein
MGLRRVPISDKLIEQTFHLPGKITRTYDDCEGNPREAVVFVVDVPDKPELQEGACIPRMLGTFTEVRGDNGKVIRLESEWRDI